MFGGLAAATAFDDATWQPKLALDLEGGTQIILAPKLEGDKQITQEQLAQAVSIIRQRVDASGVSEAEVNTQGGRNIVVSIPGKADEETRNRIESSAKLQFRAVLGASDPSTSQVIDGQEVPNPPATDDLESTPTVKPTDGSDMNWLTPHLEAEFLSYDCKAKENANAEEKPADQPLIACDTDGNIRYLLGPVELGGDSITDASAGMRATSTGASTGEWAVNITLKNPGKDAFTEVSKRLYAINQAAAGQQDPRSQFAFVLDGQVISAPTMQGIITDGKPSISGNFTQESAKSLADQLKYGALPISFTVQSSDEISATLGASQLQGGLLAGLIGLILVVIYTLFQYRLLGFVTILSLVVAGLLTYGSIALFSWSNGYRLSLAGVAGIIVAIGFTADSFIVYFERIRDELRDGRGLESAVEAGWKRAKRTIYASKGVNLLAAVVLYVMAVGNVRGFAFTLGLTTVIDVLVVVLFTHPMLQLLARTRFFSSGHPLSGLDPQALGAVYRGRAQFRAPELATKKTAGASREAAKRQTIAERKAAEAEAASHGGSERVGAGSSSEKDS
ncbi:protein translocase subunit SecD [Mycetocola spongiae]|uniref:protein translocase subunit SecD n=1 Tax=Mycetocola spongiae TaxID=2859226 RepID=UPI001CF3C2E2|nr:protein translocase subunit SecD [Mycetocola spongiae]UCR89569.1 protein translocase subunit SecD [Mycetocola spongiae]